MSMAKVLIALPAYNEANFIDNVLFEIFKFAPKKDILVVNDGSSDSTGETAENAGVNVIHHHKNKGKGIALLSAFAYAKSKKYDWVVCMDGDGQHDPTQLAHVFRRIAATDAAIILGNRRGRNEKMPFHRLLSNGASSIIISLLSGNQRIHDSQCGFRAVQTAVINPTKLKERGFQLESELLIHIGRNGGRIEEIPISTVYGKESSSIHLIKDTMKFIRLVLIYLWK